MTLAQAKANKTFIVQVSLQVVTCHPQNIFCSTGHWCQLHKHFTLVSYDCIKISWNILKTFNGNINSMDSVAYFATTKSYAKVSYSQCKQKWHHSGGQASSAKITSLGDKLTALTCHP